MMNIQECILRKITDALVPPKPKELDMATSISRERLIRCDIKITFRIQLVDINGGRDVRVVQGLTQKTASMAAAAPKRWPVMDLVELTEVWLAIPSPKANFNAFNSLISLPGGSTMSIDVIDLSESTPASLTAILTAWAGPRWKVQ